MNQNKQNMPDLNLLRKAAEQGNANAQFSLGWCYFQGEGTEKDHEKAVKWIKKAAEQGDANAQFLLGVCYFSGDGIEQDKDESIKWIKMAAGQGLDAAQKALEKIANHGVTQTQCAPGEIPERIMQMYRMDRTGSRMEVFRRLGMFMADYDDDMPWEGDFFEYDPTYLSLPTNQLRGYFHWRGCVRRGDFQPISTSAAFIYLYELLNGIGTVSPEDSLQKMRDFEVGYLDSGIGDDRMRSYLYDWRFEFAMIHAMPLAVVLQYADSDMLLDDQAMNVLRSPEQYKDDEIVQALCQLAGEKLATSPALSGKFTDRGKYLLSRIWKTGTVDFHFRGKDLFALCFGEREARPWSPLRGVVYDSFEAEQDWESGAPKTKDIEYIMDECRVYRCRDGEWEEECYDYDDERFFSFIHAADFRLRQYLQTGHYLRETPLDKWILPFMDTIIDARKSALNETSTLNVSKLASADKTATQTNEGESDIVKNTAFPVPSSGTSFSSTESRKRFEVDISVAPQSLSPARAILMSEKTSIWWIGIAIPVESHNAFLSNLTNTRPRETGSQPVTIVFQGRSYRNGISIRYHVDELGKINYLGFYWPGTALTRRLTKLKEYGETYDTLTLSCGEKTGEFFLDISEK